MKFKPNRMSTLIYLMIDIILLAWPATILVWMIDGSVDIKSVIYSLIFFIIVLMIFIVFVNIINLIYWLFIKPSLFLYDNYFSYSDTNVSYDDVDRIVFDGRY